MIKFTIPIAPVTKKNSQQIFRTRDGRPFITTSKQYKEYVKDCIFMMDKDSKSIDKPIDYMVNVKATYYLKRNGKTDISNLHSCLHDILVHYGILEDDNFKIIASTDGSRVYVDAKNPRTVVEITPMF